MHTETITNPKSNRKLTLRAWDINPKAIVTDIRNGTIKSAKDISWSLLNDEQSYQEMVDEEHGDSSDNNFALSVFENALDWALGCAVLKYIQSSPKGTIVKPFRVGASRSGNVFVITNTGRVLCW